MRTDPTALELSKLDPDEVARRCEPMARLIVRNALNKKNFYLRNQEDLDGLVYETLCDFCDEYDPQCGEPSPLMYCIAERKIASFIKAFYRGKREINRGPSLDDDNVTGAVTLNNNDDPLIILISEDSWALIRDVLKAANLSPLEYETMIKWLGQIPYEEIAATLDVHKKGIDNALQRARKKLFGCKAAIDTLCPS